ncbi:DUF2524 domain-containing protein [Paenibacillus hemerocallicola]|uniref:DUF2524 domain-containing protein n=1 Tax=Paenibacillus hemerocallicola TaxID=1172614 RepID=A0A5C4T619_9BACL|nr:DUF2524 domain-containing protein [Paenibacillus hemerocallicola]TNJ64276.1 DUF2524 domain-containing protein [Paenibacillus hemerocallicola]
MLERLESDYNCANAGDDLHELLQEAELLRGQSSGSKEDEERLNRIENQIHFIRNKCSITGES